VSGAEMPTSVDAVGATEAKQPGDHAQSWLGTGGPNRSERTAMRTPTVGREPQAVVYVLYAHDRRGIPQGVTVRGAAWRLVECHSEGAQIGSSGCPGRWAASRTLGHFGQDRPPAFRTSGVYRRRKLTISRSGVGCSRQRLTPRPRRTGDCDVSEGACTWGCRRRIFPVAASSFVRGVETSGTGLAFFRADWKGGCGAGRLEGPSSFGLRGGDV